ncbi:hypothetical protein pdul_cds_372 [Pandoravirus dulcis]|uniref:F-box domain containing protein n=1 Tax=Pandoravirus dulcis TaxID=1349409 RepID=S4VQ48_9VIRU|nr:hypothetical protein pdul_cds_372 [Pandoravirus dulcis]AGO82402.2 hypothetical protein pdul_cds_372 [Pandoravirus dulcis]
MATASNGLRARRATARVCCGRAPSRARREKGGNKTISTVTQMEQATTIKDLPDELIEMVLVAVDGRKGRAAARLTCRRWHAVSAGLFEPVDAYGYGYCLQAYMEAHGGARPSAAEGFDAKADVVLWASRGRIAAATTPPRPYDLATCMSGLGDADLDDAASGERCPQCAAHPGACACVIPFDPMEWPCGEPRPLAPGWCSDDLYEDRYPDPATEPDCVRKRSVFAVRRTPALSHWSAIADAVECAGGDVRAAAIYVGRCCGLLVLGAGCTASDVAAMSCSAAVRRAHNFTDDRLCRATNGSGYEWACPQRCHDEIDDPPLCREAPCCVHNFFERRCRVGGVRYYYDSYNVEIQPDFHLDATDPVGGLTAY